MTTPTPLADRRSGSWWPWRPALAAVALAGLATVGPATPAAAAELPCGPVPVTYGPTSVPADVQQLVRGTLRGRGRTPAAGDPSAGLYVWWQSLPGAAPVTVEETFSGATRVRVNPDASGARSRLVAALRELSPKCLSTTAPRPTAPESPTSRATGRGGVRPTATARRATPTRPAPATTPSAAAVAPVSGTGGGGPSLPWLVSGALGLGLAAWWAAAPGIGRRREQQTERENKA